MDNISELRRLLSLTQNPFVQTLLLNEITKLECVTKSEAPSQTSLKQEKPKQEVTLPTPLKVEVAQERKEFITLSNYAWDQEGLDVKIYFDLQEVGTLAKEDVQIEFTKKSIEMKIHNLKGKNYKFSISELNKAIDPDKSSFRIRPNKITITLKKKDSDHWSTIFYKEDKIKKTKTDEKDPQKGLMDLMKNLYETGDDEMKKTIAKAWTENKSKTP